MNKESIWIKGLLDMKEIMTEHKCQYFLNTGTLLGAIRENGFIPWDNDIDIAVVDYEEKKKGIYSISKEFFKKGYNVTSVKDCINISDDTGLLDLGIKFYSHQDGFYCAHQGRIEGNRACASIDLFLSDNFVYKNGRGKFGLLSIIATVVHSMRCFVPQILRRYINKKANLKLVDVRVPEEYFSEFVDYNLYGECYKVPSKYNDYLKYRYGDNWRTPKRDYNYMKDDGGIKKK